MHHCINPVLLLRQRGKLESLASSRPACTPCDIDRKGFETSQTGDPQEEVANALCAVVGRDHVTIGLAYLVRSWWKELESIEWSLGLFKLLYELHGSPDLSDMSLQRTWASRGATSSNRQTGRTCLPPSCAR